MNREEVALCNQVLANSGDLGDDKLSTDTRRCINVPTAGFRMNWSGIDIEKVMTEDGLDKSYGPSNVVQETNNCFIYYTWNQSVTEFKQ